MDKRGYVYIMASGRNGTLYTGVTSDLVKRVFQHRTGVIDGFTKRYDCKILVWFEIHDRIDEAIGREKRIKEWKRGWKLGLIETGNPDWEDLFPSLL
jgi:putative endonuclease